MLSGNLAGLALAIGTLPDGDGRARIEAAKALGFRAIALDATVLRARDLDRSARRDLAAIFRRDGLAITGWDLPIPPAHFADPARADRAISAARATIELAGDIERLTPSGYDGALVCLAGVEGVEAVRSIRDHALDRGVRCAVIAPEGSEGFDAAPRLNELQDPPRAISALGPRLACLRWKGGAIDGESIRAAMLIARCRRPILLEIPEAADPARLIAVVRARWSPSTAQ